jgi:hypothetical protein
MEDRGETSSKVRKFSRSQSVHGLLDPSEIRRVQFQNKHSEIVLDRKNFQLCGPNKLNYDKNLLTSPDNWHQVVVS